MTEAPRRLDSRQLVRQWALLRLLSASTRAYSVKELAEQLQVSKATIERDLATLEHDFALVEQSAGKQKKTYRVDRQIEALDSIRFGPMELLAIYASHSMLASLVGSPIHDDLGDVVQKIRGSLSPRHNGGLDALCNVFVPHARGHIDYSSHRDLIDQLVDAIARRRVCEIAYHAAWKGTTRRHRARPLRLLHHRSALYLLACLGDHQRITTLAVHRIRELTVSNESFPTPRVDVDAFVKQAFGIFVSDAVEDVEILFDAEIAWRVEERVFHPAEEKHRLPDGNLRYRIRTSAQWEVVPWVQTFGPFAELVAPRSWRDSIISNAAAVVSRYEAA